MPVEHFSGEIVVVDTAKSADQAIAYLLTQSVVGFDTETRPSFKRGKSNKVALLQLATEDKCFLFRLNKIGLTASIARFFASEKIKKIALSSKDDFAALNKRRVIAQKNVFEIQQVIGNYGIEELSLQKIYAILFGKKITKSQRLSNWEADQLDLKQQLYAATDAWATLRIYLRLLEIEEQLKRDFHLDINSTEK